MFPVSHHLKAQKGAVFLLTACMLPLLLAAAGLALDLSNMYAMHSRLQNEADAAAIAGAKVYNSKQETRESHPLADQKAYDFVVLNHKNMSDIKKINDAGPLPPYANNVAVINGITYYRVKLTQKIPLYILPYFTAFGLSPDIDNIDAIAYARITPGKGNPSGPPLPYFNALFAIKGNVTGLNSTQNPDIDLSSPAAVKQAYDSHHTVEISSYYSGDIVLGSEGSASYRHYFFNTAAKEAGYRDAVQALTADSSLYVNKETVDPSLDISTFISKAQEIAQAGTTYQGSSNGSQSFSTADLNTNGTAFSGYHYTNPNGGDFQISTALSGDSKTPYYVVVDNAGAPKIQMSANVDTTRPIIYCYLGTSTLNVTGSANSTFRGIIYAPNALVYINDNGWNFQGSIVANELYMSAKGTYSYVGYLKGDNGGKPQVTLSAPPPVDNPWND